MTLDARRVGDALVASAPDLARVWRAGRGAARADAFPGLLDGIVESLLAAAGDALAQGRDPALVWGATEGVVRLVARDPRRTLAELEAEWDLVEEVLGAALRALDAGEPALEWLARAVLFGRTGARALPAGGPPGILTVRLHSDPAATRRARGGGPR